MQQTNRDILSIGFTHGRLPHRIFGLLQNDRLFHQYIIGQTGTGKSSLLLSLQRQDTNANRGSCFIDPHGDVASELVKAGTNSIDYWDVADPNSPYGYNPLSQVSAAYRPLVASGLIGAFKKQWSDAWGPRMEHLLRYAILALLERPGSTMADIIPMFLDKTFKHQVLSSISDKQVQHFWRVEYPAMNFKTAVDGVAPIANKLGAFLAHPLVRRSVCKPIKPLRFRQLMDDGQTLVVNLSKGKLGADTANVLGGLIVSSIANAAYTRQNITETERKPFFLYIDEFHNLTTDALADMLSELRKYRLGLVLAHQHTTQLSKEVLEAIIGNVGTLLAFRVGATDAAIFAKQLAADVPSPRDLMNLPNYHFFIKLMIEENQSKPFSARTIAPNEGHS